MSPTFNSDIVIDFPFSRIIFAADGKHLLFGFFVVVLGFVKNCIHFIFGFVVVFLGVDVVVVVVVVVVGVVVVGVVVVGHEPYPGQQCLVVS